jgi:hypothetical protein
MGLAQSFDSATANPTHPQSEPCATAETVPAHRVLYNNNNNINDNTNNNSNNPMTMQQQENLDQDPTEQACSAQQGEPTEESSMNPVRNDAENEHVPNTATAAGLADDTDTPHDDDDDDEDEEEEARGRATTFRRRGHRMIRGSGSMDDPSLVVSEDDFDDRHHRDDHDEVSGNFSDGPSGTLLNLNHPSSFSTPYAMDRTATLLMDARHYDTSEADPHASRATNANYVLGNAHSLSPRHRRGLSGGDDDDDNRPSPSPTRSASKKSLLKSNMMNHNNTTTTTSPTTKKPHAIQTFSTSSPRTPCINPASEINSRLDTQVEVRVYPCNNSQSTKQKKYTQFTVKPEGVIIQGTNRTRTHANDLGSEYAMHIGRKLQRYELSDTRACQLLVTTHAKSFWVVPAPEAFSRHSGTCRLLGDKKHPVASHVLQVGDFLRVGSVGVVVIETHNGKENRILSEEKIQSIMRDTTNSNGGFLDLAETDDGGE